jgi:thioredoxin-like negative regulator of GroEL
VRLGLTLVVVLGLGPFSACAGPVDPEQATNQGYQTLGSGDAARALDLFAAALGRLESEDPGYKRARMGEVEAKAATQPEAAARSFLDYSAAQPGQVTAGDYHKVGSHLSARKAYIAAGEVLAAGLERFANDPRLEEAMDLTYAAAQTSGDTSAIDALRSLGYFGND